MHCVICLEAVHQPVAMACCNSEYCQACISQWEQVRSVCPLCCAPTQQDQVNQLKHHQPSEQFDDGSLMLEMEMGEIRDRVAHVCTRVANKREQSKCKKSSVPKKLMRFLEDELEKVLLFRTCMEEQAVMLNRAGTVEYMQLVAEKVLDIEDALQNNVVIEEQDFEAYQHEGYGYEDDYADYDQYEEYEQNYERKEARAGSRKAKAGAQDQKSNKIIKLS